jgi:hypothetical protein
LIKKRSEWNIPAHLAGQDEGLLVHPDQLKKKKKKGEA